MKKLKINHFGPIGEVEVELGDLTLLIGPQAVGKSLFLQFLNLLLDYASIIKTLRDYGYIVKNLEDLLGHYLGPEMAKNWEDTLSTALKSLADALTKAAELEITTQFVERAENEGVFEKDDEGKVTETLAGNVVLTAYTKINLIQGDYLDVIPVKEVNGEHQIYVALHAEHKANVAQAREYVAGLVTALVGGVKSLTS